MPPAFAEAAQLSRDRVIWKWQNAGAPGLNYCTLAFVSMKKIGQDYLEQTYDGSRSNGQEIALTVKGVRETMLEVECFSASTVPGQDPSAPPAVPGLDGLGRAAQIATSLLLPRVRGQLARVGVVPFDDQPIQNIPEVVSAGFRGRAVLPIRCYAPAQALVEYFGYISSLGVTVTADGKSFIVRAP